MCLLDVCIMDPSREIYHFTEKKIDQVEVNNRIEIAGNKYGGQIEKVLREMLQVDPERRISFEEIEKSLNNLTRNSVDNLSVHVFLCRKCI